MDSGFWLGLRFGSDLPSDSVADLAADSVTERLSESETESVIL